MVFRKRRFRRKRKVTHRFRRLGIAYYRRKARKTNFKKSVMRIVNQAAENKYETISFNLNPVRSDSLGLLDNNKVVNAIFPVSGIETDQRIGQDIYLKTVTLRFGICNNYLGANPSAATFISGLVCFVFGRELTRGSIQNLPATQLFLPSALPTDMNKLALLKNKFASIRYSFRTMYAAGNTGIPPAGYENAIDNPGKPRYWLWNRKIKVNKMLRQYQGNLMPLYNLKDWWYGFFYFPVPWSAVGAGIPTVSVYANAIYTDF